MSIDACQRFGQALIPEWTSFSAPQTLEMIDWCSSSIIAAKSQDYVWDGMYSADMDEKLLIVAVDADALPHVVGELIPQDRLVVFLLKPRSK